MSEEEIIEKVEEELKYGENCTYKYLLGQILKLYQKEKEKNKELDKIKEIIEDYYKRKGIAELTISKIEKLLEE